MKTINIVYLVRFTYDHYCQGYEDASETVLVHAPSFFQACEKIIKEGKYRKARDFENLTIK